MADLKELEGKQPTQTNTKEKKHMSVEELKLFLKNLNNKADYLISQMDKK